MIISISFIILTIAVIILIFSIQKLMQYVKDEAEDLVYENELIRKQEEEKTKKLAKINYLIETNSKGSMENLKKKVKSILNEE